MSRIIPSSEFGVCQFGEYPNFDPHHIDSRRQKIIDTSKPILELIKDIAGLNMIFIVSLFRDDEEIIQTLELIKICRNNSVFIAIITANQNAQRADLLNLKEEADIFLTLDDNPFPDDLQSDSVTYAIDLLTDSFDDELSEFEYEPFYNGSLYAFSKSGRAELFTFEVYRADYAQRQMKLKDDVIERITGKRLAIVHFKSGEDSRLWPIFYITDVIKEAAGSMIYATWRGSGSIKKRSFVTILLSDLDNPNNSYGNGKDKTIFQKKIY